MGEPIPPDDTRAIEDMASYVVRNPISLKRLVYIDDQLKQSSRTVFLLEEVSFGVELESEIFTRRWLERH